MASTAGLTLKVMRSWWQGSSPQTPSQISSVVQPRGHDNVSSAAKVPTASLSFLLAATELLLRSCVPRGLRGAIVTSGEGVRCGDPWVLAGSPDLCPKVSCFPPITKQGHVKATPRAGGRGAGPGGRWPLDLQPTPLFPSPPARALIRSIFSRKEQINPEHRLPLF